MKGLVEKIGIDKLAHLGISGGRRRDGFESDYPSG